MGLLSYLRGDDLLADCTRHTPKRGAISAPAEQLPPMEVCTTHPRGEGGSMAPVRRSASRRVRRFLGDPHG